MPDGPTLVTVVIPVLNEAAAIGDCLAQFEGIAGVEVVVSDGGSTDATRACVAMFPFARWIAAPSPGRGPQMNAGARAARGEILLFLHADSRLPRDGVALVRAAVGEGAAVGGRFRLALSERTFAFDLIARMSTLRSKLLGITYGDQAIFAHRADFEAAGGFPDRQLFEDSEFCRSLARRGRFVLLDEAVVSSTRRWREWGVWRTVFWMWSLRLLYTLSVSDARLARWYRAVR